jgi:mono/diheme cytochrome c family protein
MKLLCSVSVVLLAVISCIAQQPTPPARTLPTRLNVNPPEGQPPAPPQAPPGGVSVSPVPPAATAPVPTPPQPMNLLKWDAEMKEASAKFGDAEASWKFYFTNVSEVPVIINSASASCGCTVPKLPPLPWTNAPGATGEIPVTMNLAGKPAGITFKTVTVNTDKGPKILTVKVNIEAPPTAAIPVMNRETNQKTALADRQAVFKGDCASCHVAKGKGKLGKDLYAASCGICHDAEHRASAVPDLRALQHDTNADYWKTWISQGKPGSMMPAFATSEGGPLSEAEIASLVQYLAATIPAQAQRHAKN